MIPIFREKVRLIIKTRLDYLEKRLDDLETLNDAKVAEYGELNPYLVHDYARDLDDMLQLAYQKAREYAMNPEPFESILELNLAKFREVEESGEDPTYLIENMKEMSLDINMGLPLPLEELLGA